MLDCGSEKSLKQDSPANNHSKFQKQVRGDQTMSINRTVVTGGYVITMDDQLGDLPSGAVLMENNRIVAVAANADEFAGVDAQMIDADGGIVLPGMVDSHRHTWMSFFRSISADDSLPEFLVNTFYGLGALVRAEDIGAATMVGALEAIDSGVTTIMDCCDCVNSPDHATAAVASLQASGIRGGLCLWDASL